MGIFGHTTHIRAEKISDFTINMAKYGEVVPEILGTTRIGGNVIYYDDFTAHEHNETQGGKGGNKTVSTTYTYTVAIIIALCEGEIQGIGRVWRGQDIYDYPNEAIELTLFSGTGNQEPWGYTTAKHPEKALAYKNLAYMAGVVDMGDSASLPTFNFEVKGKLLSTGDGIDVNPADYIRYVLDKIGLEDIEIVGLDNFRTYCKEADILISSPGDSTEVKQAREIINEIMNLTNAFMFWSDNQFKIAVLEDREIGEWKPNKEIRYFLGVDDFIPQSGGALVTYQRKDSSEIYNLYPVEYLDRENGYETQSISYALSEDIADFGLRQAPSTEAHYLYTKKRAVALAERMARQAKMRRNKYTFKLDWSFSCLEVGDIVVLTDINCGLNNQPAAIDSVTENNNGSFTFTAYAMPEGKYTYKNETVDLGKNSVLPKFTVTNRERTGIDYNVDGGNTTAIIIQAPKELVTSAQEYECWIGGKGGENWGGFSVYLSDTGTQFSYMGKQESFARFGTLANSVAAGDSTIIVKSNGSFVSGTAEDASYGNTLCYLGGECFSYETATLLENGNWKFEKCVRGQKGTMAKAHNAGEVFARLDNNFFKIPYGSEHIGRTYTVKLPSFNIFGRANQDISEVNEFTYTPTSYLPAGGEEI